MFVCFLGEEFYTFCGKATLQNISKTFKIKTKKQNNFTGQKYKKAATYGSLIQHVLYSSVPQGMYCV